MGVNLCCPYVSVAEKLLDVADVGAVVQQMGCKGVP